MMSKVDMSMVLLVSLAASIHPDAAYQSEPAGHIGQRNEPAIRLVPRAIDPHFAERQRLCLEQSTITGFPLANDGRRAVQDFLGPALVEMQVHQTGDSLVAFAKLESHLRALLQARPKSLTRFPNWAESTPFRSWGVLGTVHYTRDRTGRVETVGTHLCVTDSTGVTWWMRLERADVWGDGS